MCDIESDICQCGMTHLIQRFTGQDIEICGVNNEDQNAPAMFSVIHHAGKTVEQWIGNTLASTITICLDEMFDGMVVEIRDRSTMTFRFSASDGVDDSSVCD